MGLDEKGGGVEWSRDLEKRGVGSRGGGRRGGGVMEEKRGGVGWREGGRVGRERELRYV